MLDAALASSGLDRFEFGIYSVLTSAETSPPLSWPVGCRRHRHDPSYVKRLEGRGHVSRDRNPGNGRSYLLHLTPAGRRAHQAAGMAFLPVLQRVVDRLGRHEPGVRRSLASLREAIDDLGVR